MSRYPTADEFKTILLSMPLLEVVRTHVLQGLPYVFRDNPESLKVLNQHLCGALPLKTDDIRVVGSARTGFSLSPDNFPRQFSDGSDIDVLVVDEALFDTVWLTMLRWHYPRRIVGLPDTADKRWVGVRKTELYWGWFVPNHIRYNGLSLPKILAPIRDMSTAWFNAFQNLSRHPTFAGRTVSGRLYRTWDHATLYHADGLRQIKESLV